MPKRSLLTERFRRVSTPDVFRRSSKVEPTLEPLAEPTRPTQARSKSVPDTLLSHSIQAKLLTLPTELSAEILSYVGFEDLCAVRLICRTTHYLVSEGDIVRQWMNEYIDPHRLSLHPAPSPPTFVYLLEQQRRSGTVIETAHVLVEYIEHEILRHTLRRANIDTDQYRQGLFGLVKIRLREKMMPLLFTIQAYLELKAAALLSPSSTAENDQCDKTSREHTFFTSLQPPHLHQSHKCFLFLTWLSNQILARPSYVGTMERTMRGWLSDPLDITNYHLYFLFGGVGALAKLVQLPSYKHRRRAVEAWTRGLDPEQNVLWREKWGMMVAKFGVVPGREEVVRALGLKLAVEEIWVERAREALVEGGSLKAGEEGEVGTPWQTMDFLCDIAGYDVLHTPPSWSRS